MPRSVEQIMLGIAESKIRVLGVLSPDNGAGVSTLCHLVAMGFARARTRTLLIDLTQRVISPGEQRPVWSPSMSAAELIEVDPAGYDLIQASPTLSSRELFNNIDTVRRLLAEELSNYDMIIVDLPAVLDEREDKINPVAVARACDSVIMLCVTGRTTHQQIERTVAMLATAGVQLGGTVLNDVDASTPER